MGTGGQAWCSGLVGILLVAAGATAELYDELLAPDDAGYQNNNDIDTGPPLAEKKLFPRLARGQDAMLYRILKALQLQNSPSYSAFSSNRVPTEAHEHDDQPELMAKGQVFKRLASFVAIHGQGYKSDFARPQQKWKIKKGKVIGSQMVCYFKLCAFRSPA